MKDFGWGLLWAIGVLVVLVAVMDYLLGGAR